MIQHMLDDLVDRKGGRLSGSMSALLHRGGRSTDWPGIILLMVTRFAPSGAASFLGEGICD